MNRWEYGDNACYLFAHFTSAHYRYQNFEVLAASRIIECNSSVSCYIITYLMYYAAIYADDMVPP